jgi:hypothetical protein
MKRYIIFLFLCFCNFLFIRSAAQPRQSPKTSVDPNGNISIIGIFQDSVSFNGGTVSYHSTSFSTASGIFVAQLDSSFNLKWCHVISCDWPLYSEKDIGIVSDRFGNTYIGGEFSYVLVLDSTTTITPSGGEEAIFLAKYDSLGNLLWSRKNTGYSNTEAFDLDIDTSDNIYFSSKSYPWICFGADTLNLSNGSAYIAKFDPDGNNLWLSELRGNKKIYDFQTDPAGNSFIIGTCVDTQYCGVDTIYHSGTNSFIASCSPSGIPRWQRLMRGPMNNGNSVGVGPNGKPTAFGVFKEYVTFNLTDTFFQIGGYGDNFIANYSAAGTELWTIQAYPSPYADYENFLTRVDWVNNIYLATKWTYTSIYSIDTGNISTAPFAGYFFKIDSSHNLLCHISIKNNFFDPSMSIDYNNNLYISGRTSDRLIINSDTVYNGDQFFYVAKFDDACHLLHTEIITSPFLYTEGIPTTLKDDFVDIFPNPVSNTLNIQFKTSLSENAIIKVFNSDGRMLFSETATNKKVTLHMAKLPPGTYVVEVINGSSRQVKKVTKN